MTGTAMVEESATAAPCGPTACAHCGLPLPRAPYLDAQDRRAFCCEACRLVAAAIREAGLEAYYARRGAPPLRRAELPPEQRMLNTPEVQASYALPCGDLLEVNLLLDGMHCAACSWLVEASLGRLEGVCEARVNYATARLRVRFEPSRLGLGDVAQAVAGLGYRATPYHPHQQERPRSRHSNDLLLRLAAAGFAAGNGMLLAAALYAGAWSGIEERYRMLFHWVSLGLATLVVVYAAVPFYRGALSALRARSMTMDVPITLGLLTTYAYSLWALRAGRAEVYFDTVCAFVFVLLIGRVVEDASRGRVSGAVERLLTLGVRSARLRRGDTWVDVPLDEVVPGDQVEVVQGQRVPVDGCVREGAAWVDTSMLTGEPLPRAVVVDDEVSAGTVCTDGRILVQATRTGSATTLASIARLVEEAQMRRAPLQRLVDRFAGIFVSMTIALGVAAFAGWWPSRGLEEALIIGVSVLIITCPCALGLATPLAVACAAGRAASRGILFRGGDVLEALGGITHILLDKTGTLTEGRFELTEVVLAPAGLPSPSELRPVGTVASAAGAVSTEAAIRDRWLQLAVAAERDSRHPVASCLKAATTAEVLVPSSLESWPGRGVRAVVAEHAVLLGSRELMEAAGLALPPELEVVAQQRAAAQSTVVWLAVDGAVRALLVLADRIREEACEVVATLRARGLEVQMLSGDSQAAAEAVARVVGIPVARGSLLPQDKAEAVRQLQQAGARVLLVGDGINDAPALSLACVGMAVASGTDIATAAADVVLLRPGLAPLLEALELARATFATIRDNMALSALYNLVALPTAVLGYVAPLVAAVIMPISGLFVVASSMRLWRDPQPVGATSPHQPLERPPTGREGA